MQPWEALVMDRPARLALATPHGAALPACHAGFAALACEGSRA